MIKPAGCLSCSFKFCSTGFVADQGPVDIDLALPTLFAIVGRFPSKDDLVNKVPLSGRAGRAFEAQFLLPLGIRREQLIISNVLRCYPNAGEFPIAKQRADAVKACRRWDTALTTFNPNLWGITIAPGMLLKSPNQADFLRRALSRAKAYAEAGWRPCLLMGEEAKDCYAPWLEGGQKKWQGHWEAA